MAAAAGPPVSPFRTPGSAKQWSTTTYIPPEGFERLMSYKYKGTDQSLIYKHILTPMNQVLIEYIPLWMAPNLITVIGLLCVLASHFLMWYYVPDLYGEAPRWVYAFSGWMLLVYQTLDNLDGKQARRVGASSPLGLFFDHGCDAINCTIGSLTLMSATQMGSTWKSVSLLMSTIFLFFLNTWEEYYTGELILPIVNGPTEGLIVGAGILWWTAWAGPDWWLQKLTVSVPEESFLQLDGLFADYLPAHERFAAHLRQHGTIEIQYNGILALIMVGITLFTLLGNLITVYRAVHKSHEGEHGKYTDSWLVRRLPFIHACTRLLPFLCFTALAMMWMAVSPAEILPKHPRLIFWTIGFLFAKMVTHLMIAHLCSVEYHPLRRTLMPFFFFAGHSALSWANKRGEFQVNEELVLYEFFALASFSYCHMSWSCIQEFKAVLGILCFRLPSAKRQ